MVVILVAILLMVIRGYFIGWYWRLLMTITLVAILLMAIILVAILLMVIDGYSISGYWWLLY